MKFRNQELQEFRSGAESHATRAEFFIAWTGCIIILTPESLLRPIL
jgi:hypothetical protein